MDVEYIITTLIALLALVVSGLSAWYCKRNFSMSKYEFDKRREFEKRADLIAAPIKTAQGVYTFVVKNVGKSDARNIVCNFSDEEFEGYVLSSSIVRFPTLYSGQSFNVKAYAYEGKNDTPTIIATWEDDYSASNTKALTLSL